MGIGLPTFDLVPWGPERPSFAIPAEAPTTAPPTTKSAQPGSAKTPSSTKKSSSGRSVKASTVLRWPRVARAAFYNVVLWRDGERVADVWPQSNSVEIRDGKAAGRHLTPGRYQWFAFAAFRKDGKTTFGPVLARGDFRVAA